MTTQIQRRKGTTAQHSSFTGAEAEITIDTDKETVVVHDGSTAGGFPLLRAEGGAQDISTSGDITVNSNALFVDASAKRVGIGTDSPTSALDVQATTDPAIRIRATGTGSSDDTMLRLSIAGTTANNYIYFGDGDDSNVGQIRYQHSSNALSFTTAANERLRIDSSGRLLVGTSVSSSPVGFSHLVQVEGLTSTTSSLSLTRSGANSAGGTITLSSNRSTSVGGYDAAVNGDTLGQILFNGANGTNRANFSARIRSVAEETFSTTTCASNLRFETCKSGDIVPTERMRISSSGNVGIGTDSPGAKLEVDSGSTITNTVFRTGTTQNRLRFINTKADGTGTSNVYIGTVHEDFAILTSALTRFTINKDGNVGIGTTSPRSRLEVDGTLIAGKPSDYWATSATYIDVNGWGGLGSHGGYEVTLTAGGYRKGSSQWEDYTVNGASGYAAQIALSPYNGNIHFKTDSGKTSGSTSAITKRMTILSNGNVGIGTTSPASNLHIKNSTWTTLKIEAGSDDPMVSLIANGGTWQLHNDNSLSNNFQFRYNNGIKAYITSGGSGVFDGTVSAQGSVLTSDQRFKTNLTDANSQLSDVTALGNSLRNWDWTADAPVADKDTRFLGLVAQEVETVCPGIVATISRTKDGDELTPEVVTPAVYETQQDEEGNDIQVEVTPEQITPATYEQLDDSYKGIKNDILIMKLLGAVAELSAKVAALEAA